MENDEQTRRAASQPEATIEDDEQARREAAEELWSRLRVLEEQNKALQLALFVALNAAIAAGASGPHLIASLQGFAADRQRMDEEAGVALLGRLIVGLETLEKQKSGQPTTESS